MNSLFNYELDERNIRLTLKEADVQFNESAWEDFDRNFNITSPKQGLEFKLPKIELNINRNVMVPVLFIMALGGISALLFSFVDFKSNKKEQVEKALVPNADNYKKENVEVATQSAKKENPIVTISQTDKPVENKTTNDPAKTEPENKVPVLQSTQHSEPVVATNTSQMVSPDNRQNVSAVNHVAQRSVDSVKSSPSAVITDPSNNNYRKSRRKKKNITAEQIETIKAPSLVGSEAAPEEEQELKLQ